MASVVQLSIFKPETGAGEVLTCLPCDGIRAVKWAEDNNLTIAPEQDAPILAYFLLKRIGRLADYELPQELTVADLDGIVNTLGVIAEQVPFKQAGFKKPAATSRK